MQLYRGSSHEHACDEPWNGYHVDSECSLRVSTLMEDEMFYILEHELEVTLMNSSKSSNTSGNNVRKNSANARRHSVNAKKLWQKLHD